MRLDADSTKVPLGLGMDIVDVADVEDSLLRFGDRYLRRVYTPARSTRVRAEPTRGAWPCISPRRRRR